MKKRDVEMHKLIAVMKQLEKEVPLLAKFKDHPLIGNYKNCRECHIKPDWLLIYQLNNELIVFTRTGTHSDLF